MPSGSNWAVVHICGNHLNFSKAARARCELLICLVHSPDLTMVLLFLVALSIASRRQSQSLPHLFDNARARETLRGK